MSALQWNKKFYCRRDRSPVNYFFDSNRQGIMTKFIQNDLNIDFHKGGKKSAKNAAPSRVDGLLNP